MREKNKIRARLEAMEIGRTIIVAGAIAGSPAYSQANSYVQRVRLASASAKTFRLKQKPKSLTITRVT